MRIYENQGENMQNPLEIYVFSDVLRLFDSFSTLESLAGGWLLRLQAHAAIQQDEATRPRIHPRFETSLLSESLNPSM